VTTFLLQYLERGLFFVSSVILMRAESKVKINSEHIQARRTRCNVTHWYLLL